MYDDEGISIDTPIYDDDDVIVDKPMNDYVGFDELSKINFQIFIKYDDQLLEMKDSKYEDVFASILSQNASYNNLFRDLSGKKEFGSNFEHQMWLMSNTMITVLMKMHRIR